MGKKIKLLVAGSGGIILIAFVLDLFDIPSRIGLDMGAINWDTMTLIVGNVLVILIAYVTYLLIDQRNCKKEINQRSNAVYLLRTIYSGLKNAVNTSQKQSFSIMLAALDSEQRENIKKFFLDLCTFMQDSIRTFSEDGVITSKEFENYLNICASYMYNMNLCFMLTPEIKIISPETVSNNNKTLLRLINSAVEELDKSE